MLELAALLLFCTPRDGDTIVCNSEVVRVMGVDTPEMDCRCPVECAGAAAAKARTEALISEGVYLERHGADKFRRTLARVVLPDGRILADVLVSEGLGRVYHGERRRSWCG